MSKNYTKDLIKKEFMNLLDKKTLNKITVTELAKKCDIERIVIEEFNENLSWEDSFILAATFILENKKAIRHIYYSDYKANVEKYVYSMAGEVITKYVKHISKDTRAKDIDINLISYFYQCALSTALIQWIAIDMKTDPVLVTNRIGKLMDGNILLSLKRSESLEKVTQSVEIE